jgi:hypothetical protein
MCQSDSGFVCGDGKKQEPRVYKERKTHPPHKTDFSARLY